MFRHTELHLWVLRVRMRSIFPAFLFFQRGKGMPGKLQGTAKEGARWSREPHQGNQGKMTTGEV